MRCKLRGGGGGEGCSLLACVLLSRATRISRLMSRIRQSRISSLRPVLRMLGWSSRPLVRGNEDAGYEGIYAFVRLIVRQATYNLVPRVFLFKKREDIGARLRLPRVNKTTDMKRWNNKHVHHKIFMEIKVISCYLQFNIMQSLHLFTLPPPRSLNKHHLMHLNIYYIYIYKKPTENLRWESYLPTLSVNL